jgi:hypothetical protein
VFVRACPVYPCLTKSGCEALRVKGGFYAPFVAAQPVLSGPRAEPGVRGGATRALCVARLRLATLSSRGSGGVISSPSAAYISQVDNQYYVNQAPEGAPSALPTCRRFVHSARRTTSPRPLRYASSVCTEGFRHRHHALTDRASAHWPRVGGRSTKSRDWSCRRLSCQVGRPQDRADDVGLRLKVFPSRAGRVNVARDVPYQVNAPSRRAGPARRARFIQLRQSVLRDLVRFELNRGRTPQHRHRTQSRRRGYADSQGVRSQQDRWATPTSAALGMRRGDPRAAYPARDPTRKRFSSDDHGRICEAAAGAHSRAVRVRQPPWAATPRSHVTAP